MPVRVYFVGGRVLDLVVPEDILLADFVARTAPIGGRIRRLEFNLGR